MNFVSDNAYGATEEILAALRDANVGAVTSYGDDPITARVQKRLSDIFEHDLVMHPVVTGTAANALALATLCPPHGTIFCHRESHIAVDECAAPEFYSHGAKLAHLPGTGAKIDPAAIAEALPDFQRGVHSTRPSVVSITQATELGTVYKPAEIRAIAEFAHRNGMTLHVDGARFANALVSLGASPAELTWRAGVDAMSFGATKNGALCAEAVIFFDAKSAADFEYRRKKGGHLVSKMRFVSAQLEAYLANDNWLRTAQRANGLAQRLGQAIARIDGAELASPVETNAVFAFLPDPVVAKLRKAGAQFYDWQPPAGGRTLARLVLSFATPEEDITRFVEIASG
jgi:threonine aldolase